MDKSSIGVSIFGGVVALVAALNSPPVANYVSSLLGKSEQPLAAAPGDASNSGIESAAANTAPGDAPAADSASSEIVEGTSDQGTDVASVADGKTIRPKVIEPSFGLLRVEPDGSTVIAGQAGPDAQVDILAGNDTLTSTKAAVNGDFVAVLDTPLNPGDYEIVLRSTEDNGSTAMSSETAIVSVPEKGNEGEVLALVEKPGTPSRLITTPEGAGKAETGGSVETQTEVASAPEKPEETATPGEAGQSAATDDAPKPAEDGAEQIAALPRDEQPAAAMPEGGDEQEQADAPSEDAPDGETEVAAIPADQASPAAEGAAPEARAGRQPRPAGKAEIRIEAVEIDNDKVFVAGSAEPGAQVRFYANDILLGDTIASQGGRVLVEAQQDLPVGDYIIRADVIDPNTADVKARAAVPFARGEGDRLSAVAVDPDAEMEPEAVPQGNQAANNAEAQPDGGEQVASAPAGETATAGEAGVEVPLASSSGLAGPPQLSPDVPTKVGRLRQTDSSVIIRRGDTLWQISRRIYGRGIRYTTIYLANQDQIVNPDRIWPGQIFALPGEALPESGEVSQN